MIEADDRKTKREPRAARKAPPKEQMEVSDEDSCYEPALKKRGQPVLKPRKDRKGSSNHSEHNEGGEPGNADKSILDVSEDEKHSRKRRAKRVKKQQQSLEDGSAEPADKTEKPPASKRGGRRPRKGSELSVEVQSQEEQPQPHRGRRAKARDPGEDGSQKPAKEAQSHSDCTSANLKNASEKCSEFNGLAHKKGPSAVADCKKSPPTSEAHGASCKRSKAHSQDSAQEEPDVCFESLNKRQSKLDELWTNDKHRPPAEPAKGRLHRSDDDQNNDSVRESLSHKNEDPEIKIGSEKEFRQMETNKSNKSALKCLSHFLTAFDFDSSVLKELTEKYLQSK